MTNVHRRMAATRLHIERDVQQGAQPALILYPKGPGETIYWLKASIIRDDKALVSMLTLFQVDSDLMH